MQPWPLLSRPFILQTNASERRDGAVLSQRSDDSDNHPIAYFSKKLLPREERILNNQEGVSECLAIKMAMNLLIGQHFTMETDHRSLMWLDKLKDSNSCLTRWSLSLQLYNFTL